MRKLKEAKESVFKESTEPEGLHIRGYDFSGGVDLKGIIESFRSTGFQASYLGKAIEIAKKMRQENTTIFLGMTADAAFSGVREAVAYLVKNKAVHAIVTTAGAIESDIMKINEPFTLSGRSNKGKGARMENIVSCETGFFKKLFQELLIGIYESQEKTGKLTTPSEICRHLGNIADETSILYWAAKNEIPVFCPGIVDGEIGNIISKFKSENPGFKLDVSDDIVALTDMVLDAKETGAIILGGSLPKHHIMNANMMREGTKYAIYINTAIEGDGSDSGALPEEAKSWGKASADVDSVKIQADATIVFPLLVAGAFSDL